MLPFKFYRRLRRQCAGWGEMPLEDETPEEAPLLIAPEQEYWYRLYLKCGDLCRYVDGYPTAALAWEALMQTPPLVEPGGPLWLPVVRIETGPPREVLP